MGSDWLEAETPQQGGLSLRHQCETKPSVILAACMLAAAMQAGGGAAELAHALHRGVTGGTGVGQLALNFIARQRQAVLCLFTGDAEICTGLTPLAAMRLDALPTAAMVGDQMCQLMLQGALNLAFKFAQLGVQLDGPARIARIARRAAQT